MASSTAKEGSNKETLYHLPIFLGPHVLSRTLNQLKNNPDFHGFYMEKKGTIVNHSCFADDIILFSSRRAKTLKLIMQTLKYYEDISNEMVDGDKRHFMIHPNAFDTTRDRIKRITGFKNKQGPITYLGCPLFFVRPRIIYFSNIVNNVICKIIGW